MTNSNHPADTIRSGNLKATIWRNENEQGAWYSTELTRTYKTSDGFKETTSFRSTDLLRIALLAQQAYLREQQLRSADKMVVA